MKPSDFYTVPLSESGARIPLLRPDGSDSGEWILVLGPDCDAFIAASDQLNRENAAVGGLEGADRESAAIEALLKFRATLILGWSFDEPCDDSAKRALLKNAPRIAMKIDTAAGDITRFFGPASPSSTPGQNANGGSGAVVTSSLPGDLV